jgi:hypothetical protein
MVGFLNSHGSVANFLKAIVMPSPKEPHKSLPGAGNSLTQHFPPPYFLQNFIHFGPRNRVGGRFSSGGTSSSRMPVEVKRKDFAKQEKMSV